MPSLLSGSLLRTGGSGEFIRLQDAMPQLPESASTTTGFTVITNSVLQTRYSSSLGNIEFTQGRLYSNLADGVITVLTTGTTSASTSTSTGNLVVQGGVGIGRNLYVEEDIVVNGITMGRGYEGQNNLVMQGVAETPLNEFSNGQENIVIGYDALKGLTTAYKSIAIGRYALSSGTFLANSIAIGDSALKNLGTVLVDNLMVITVTTQANPVIVTAVGHAFNTGTYVFITGVVGMVELNNQYFYVDKISNDDVALYSDNILSTPVDGTGFTPYSGSGTIARPLITNNNIAIGTNAGERLIDGEKNFFFGDQIAKNLTTGSFNFFAGNDVGGNITHGNGIIAIGADNLVDGVDNQVNIGSVFYYNGLGHASLNADTEIGIGQESTSPVTGALTVVGGTGVLGNVYIGGNLHVTSTGTSTYFSGNVVPVGDVNLGNPDNPFNTLYLKGKTLYLSTVTLKANDALTFNVESTAGYVTQTVGNLHLNSGVASSSTYNGSLIVDGGVGIGGDVNILGYLSVMGPENVILSPTGNSVYIQPTVGGTVTIYPSEAGSMDHMVIGLNNAEYGTFTNVAVISGVVSSSTITGALRVVGGAGIQGSVYSNDGNVDENYLLYTPRVFITSNVLPIGPRIGDIWIDSSVPAYLQYIKEGTSTFWIQVGAV
jgi:hypothetical protein